ncbi:hypothetical protein V6N11_053620 [Hibiscus sabdariffa]|uniref:Uncharacterized protein n=1 Tax=Hibiscus sabdariffa TaxID=183260 RepID=A0ABR2UDL7_9ROSI
MRNSCGLTASKDSAVEGESRDQVDETIPVEKVGNTSSGAAAGTMPMRAGSIRRVDIGNGAGSSVAPRQTGGWKMMR